MLCAELNRFSCYIDIYTNGGDNISFSSSKVLFIHLLNYFVVILYSSCVLLSYIIKYFDDGASSTIFLNSNNISMNSLIEIVFLISLNVTNNWSI